MNPFTFHLWEENQTAQTLASLENAMHNGYQYMEITWLHKEILITFFDREDQGAVDLAVRRLEGEEMVSAIRQHFSHWSRQQEAQFRGFFGDIWELTLPDGTGMLYTRCLNEAMNELLILQ